MLSPLYETIIKNDMKGLEEILRNGGDPREPITLYYDRDRLHRDDFLINAFYNLRLDGFISFRKYINKGENGNKKICLVFNPLQIAALKKNPKAIELLLQYSKAKEAYVNETSDQEISPIFCAVTPFYKLNPPMSLIVETVKKLLEHGANITTMRTMYLGDKKTLVSPLLFFFNLAIDKKDIYYLEDNSLFKFIHNYIHAHELYEELDNNSILLFIRHFLCDVEMKEVALKYITLFLIREKEGKTNEWDIHLFYDSLCRLVDYYKKSSDCEPMFYEYWRKEFYQLKHFEKFTFHYLLQNCAIIITTFNRKKGELQIAEKYAYISFIESLKNLYPEKFIRVYLIECDNNKCSIEEFKKEEFDNLYKALLLYSSVLDEMVMPLFFKKAVIISNVLDCLVNPKEIDKVCNRLEKLWGKFEKLCDETLDQPLNIISNEEKQKLFIKNHLINLLITFLEIVQSNKDDFIKITKTSFFSKVPKFEERSSVILERLKRAQVSHNTLSGLVEGSQSFAEALTVWTVGAKRTLAHLQKDVLELKSSPGIWEFAPLKKQKKCITDFFKADDSFTSNHSDIGEIDDFISSSPSKNC